MAVGLSGWILHVGSHRTIGARGGQISSSTIFIYIFSKSIKSFLVQSNAESSDSERCYEGGGVERIGSDVELWGTAVADIASGSRAPYCIVLKG